jgi:hypothetical protein
MAMWKIYSNTEGLAIQSTYKRLCKSFEGYTDTDVWNGKVKYIDYGNDPILLYNANQPFVYKRKAFEYERELRVAISKYPLQSIVRPDANIHNWLTSPPVSIDEQLSDGLQVPVNLGLLVERIVVSPSAQKWFLNLVKSTTVKYGLQKKVISSALKT